MERALAAIPSHQPSSRTYQVMIAVMYYGGLRPSEAIMLRPRALQLPDEGWGRIDVVEADISFDQSGEPKTGRRTVPIPPVLVTMLRKWIDENGFAADELIFRTRTGNRPTASNWSRTWQRALRQIGHPPLRVYDCRHAAATTWLAAGVPLGEVARRMGHSVDTLVSTYVGALTGDEDLANRRIDALLAGEADLASVDQRRRWARGTHRPLPEDALPILRGWHRSASRAFTRTRQDAADLTTSARLVPRRATASGEPCLSCAHDRLRAACAPPGSRSSPAGHRIQPSRPRRAAVRPSGCLSSLLLRGSWLLRQSPCQRGSPWRPRVSTGVAPGRVHCAVGRLVGPQLATPSASVRQYQQIGAPWPPEGEPASGASGQPSGLSSHASRRP